MFTLTSSCSRGLDGTEGGLHLTACRLRAIAVLDDHDEQRARFRNLVGDTVAPAVRVVPKGVASRDGDRRPRPCQTGGRAKR